jgi:hypothetical protein
MGFSLQCGSSRKGSKLSVYSSVCISADRDLRAGGRSLLSVFAFPQ